MPATCQSCGQELPVAATAEERCPRCGAANPPPAADRPVIPIPPANLGMRVVVVAEDRPSSPVSKGSGPAVPPLRPVLVSSGTEGPVPQDKAARRCPSCGGLVRVFDERCPECRRDLYFDDEYRPWEEPGGPLRRDVESHRGPIILTLGIISLAFCLPAMCGFLFSPFGLTGVISVALGLTAWYLGLTDSKKIRDKLMDPEGLRATETGKSCGLVGAILGGLGLVFCGVIQAAMLIMHRR